MLNLPLIFWISLNSLSCVALFQRKPVDPLHFLLSLGISAVSCGFLGAGMLGSFFMLELSLPLLHWLSLAALWFLSPPGENDIWRRGIPSGVRFLIALIVVALS